MIRRASDRLAVAVIASAIGAMVALLAGLPEAAVLVAPWMVLLVLGLSNARPDRVRASVEPTADRVLVGDDIEIVTTISGAAGSVVVKCRPAEGFWSTASQPAPDHDSKTISEFEVADIVQGERTTVRCTLPATQWGNHDVGRVQIEITEPYGLFFWTGLVVQTAKVRIHPTPTELQNLLAPWLMRRVAGAHGSRAIERGIEYADIRPFAAGDSLREINWRASARSDELWVSQRHPDRATDVVLILDSFVEAGHDAKTVVGMAIEAAVALAESHLAVTDRVGLVELGGIVRWVTPGTGKLQLQRLTDELLATSLYENAAAQGLAVVPPRAVPPRSFVIALTPLLDQRFIDALFVLGARGHDVAVIESASSWSDDDANERESARLADRLWQAERQLVRDRLAEQGVSIVQWGQGEPLDVKLDELARRRRRIVSRARRL
jgi:uncharacterized protein (DUF58 family)